MKIQLIAIGQTMPIWVTLGCNEYLARLKKPYTINMVGVSPVKRYKNTNPNIVLKQEALKLEKYLSPHEQNIMLDRKGTHIDTIQLARFLQTALDTGDNINFVIGGAEGIAPSLLEKSNKIWSLSALTFPHPLVRVILCEQLYRAYSINAGHPYHR